jgi:hypothetical protein
MQSTKKLDDVAREIEDDQRVYGKPTKARSLEPSVFELMAGPTRDDDFRYSKKSWNVFRHLGEYNKYKNRICKAENNYVSEMQDNFRPFTFITREFEENENDEEEEEVNKNEHIQSHLIQRELERRSSQKAMHLKMGQIGKEAEKIAFLKEKEKTLGINEGAPKVIINNKELTFKPDQSEFKKKNETGHKGGADVQHKNASIKQELLKLKTTTHAIQKEPDTKELGNKNVVNNHAKMVSNKVEDKLKRNQSHPGKEKERRRLDRIRKFEEQTRWLPNSGFQTYYGRPAFENYGYRNTNPSWGGLLYGSYMKSFNINPQRGENHPPFEQVYISSQLASEKVNYSKDHMPRKCKDEYAHSQNEVKELINRLPLTIRQNGPIKKCGSLIKPNLLACTRFMSKADEELDLEDQEVSEEEQELEEAPVITKKKNDNPFLVEAIVNKTKINRVRPNTAKVTGKKNEDIEERSNEPLLIAPIKNKLLRESSSTSEREHKTVKIIQNQQIQFANKFLQAELNPQNYVGMSSKMLNQIPAAGKIIKQSNNKLLY